MITTKETEKIAHLARLEFSEGEVTTLTGDLNNILGYIDQLKELDVTSVEPLENINESVEINTFRADQAEASLPISDVLKNAPKSGDGFFLVPKVIEQSKKDSTIVEEEDDFIE